MSTLPSGKEENVQHKDVFLRITRPVKSNGIAVVFGSGGSGDEFFPMQRFQNNVTEPFEALIDQGYTIISRSWVDGWFGSGADSGEGVGELSFRYKQLIKKSVKICGFQKFAHSVILVVLLKLQML